jgi:hypothetical protein
MKTKTYMCFLFALILLAAGCTDDTPIAEPQEHAAGTKYSPLNYPPEANPWLLADNALDEEERNAIYHEYGMMMIESSNTTQEIRTKKTWMDAHEIAVKAFKKNKPSRFHPALELPVANEMLSDYLLPLARAGESSDDFHEALAFYTTVLIDYELPSAHLILPALSHLRGYWPEQKIRDSAAEVIRLSNDYLNKQNFVSKAIGDERTINELIDAQQKVHHQIYFAIADFQKLTEETE